jgi:uncharacterized repeat protein (TIGR03803 family)
MGRGLTVRHSFCETACNDGKLPAGGLVMDQAGNLFGTTQVGGARDGGTVFELVPGAGRRWSYRVLYNFCTGQCIDGSMPFNVRLVLDTAGDLFGTTINGGTKGQGTAFKITRGANGKRWTHSVIYNFCSDSTAACFDGAWPVSALTYAGAETGAPYDGISPLYGVTQSGGRHVKGVAYSLSPKPAGRWSERPLYSFCKEPDCADGSLPTGLIADAAGNLYGTSSAGGGNDGIADGGGTVFKLSPGSQRQWNESVLYRFCAQTNCADGARPAGLVRDAAGNLFGTTNLGGTTGANCQVGGCGVVYEIAIDGTQSVLHTFCSRLVCRDGSQPQGALTLDDAGNLFGTTGSGGKRGRGTVFRLNGELTTLYNFCRKVTCADGNGPSGALLLDSLGDLFGTTLAGGKTNDGTVFELVP